MTRLHDWDDKFVNHLVFGAEAFLADNIWIGGGLNPRRSDEMKISDGETESSHGAGLSFGDAQFRPPRDGAQVRRTGYGVLVRIPHVSDGAVPVPRHVHVRLLPA